MLRCLDQSDGVIQQRPVLALSIIVVVGAAAYAVVSLLLRQTVNPVEVGVFAAVFAAVYLAFARYSGTIEEYLPG